MPYATMIPFISSTKKHLYVYLAFVILLDLKVIPFELLLLLCTLFFLHQVFFHWVLLIRFLMRQKLFWFFTLSFALVSKFVTCLFLCFNKL
jgi:hypothetical protein